MAEVSTAKKRVNPFKAIAKYFREIKSEMKKVVWPSKKTVINNTIIVIAAVVIIGLFIWVLDAVFQFGIFSFINR